MQYELGYYLGPVTPPCADGASLNCPQDGNILVAILIGKHLSWKGQLSPRSASTEKKKISVFESRMSKNFRSKNSSDIFVAASRFSRDFHNKETK